jgi:hypothetical protein
MTGTGRVEEQTLSYINYPVQDLFVARYAALESVVGFSPRSRCPV